MAFFKKKYNTGRDGLSRDTMINGARLITAAEPKIRSQNNSERSGRISNSHQLPREMLKHYLSHHHYHQKVSQQSRQI